MSQLNEVKEQEEDESKSSRVHNRRNGPIVIYPVVTHTSSEMQSLADEYAPQLPKRTFLQSSPSLSEKQHSQYCDEIEETMCVGDYYSSLQQSKLVKTNGRCLS